MYHCPRKPKVIPCYDIEKGIPTPYYKKEQQQHRVISFLCFLLVTGFCILILLFNLQIMPSQVQKSSPWLAFGEDEHAEDKIVNTPDFVPVAPPPPPPPVQNHKQVILESKDPSIESNLKEIFSINPIIILSTNEVMDEFESVLLNLNIHPKPKVINLLKHPNFANIMEYLKNINGNNIPRLFIGGFPIGTDTEILEMNRQNQLVYYLKEKGRGLISIE